MAVWKEAHIRCDECGRTLSIPNTELPIKLVFPWRKVHIRAWVGTFHTCSDRCEVDLRKRYSDLPEA